MGWILVLLAALSEFAGVIGLKKFSENKTLGNGLLYYGGFGIAFFFLYNSFKFLQVSTAYAVWIGIGTAGAVLINMVFFGESKSTGRVVSLILIVIGVVGLKALS
ncbi:MULTISPECIES: DMT family transporter [Sporosarcina]|uniref:Multidrug resistance protein SMR n=1 Tax=Sporosarcina ureae TaxID=1571 RepID=A0ABM6JYG3_SPOUR|nr:MULTISPECIES: multidrug efflux SMR transporter [Sporosarcina]ARF15014.1 multidrug resistance protein SMR [Sporosarcina ureae]PIC58411.1 QacE family quaternary ammonium compound efflux SMR transporter [Sporosarcina sp. P10]PIC61424.1 QacE family quaternary ammonium compound efflux SMR transporter [Sporosarcina sp. P12(2017)]PIC76017.1 QacE family quaternary ammonium compound efflux SMR transporter [Sporosarcina sp. P19]